MVGWPLLIFINFFLLFLSSPIYYYYYYYYLLSSIEDSSLCVIISDGTDEVNHRRGNKRWQDPSLEQRLNRCLCYWRGYLDHSMPPINTLDGYGTNCIDRWRYIKTPLQSRRRYLKETLTPQRLEPKAMYIKPSTLPWKGTKKINLRKRKTIGQSLLFCIHSIILFWLWHQRCFGRHHTDDHPQQKKFP